MKHVITDAGGAFAAARGCEEDDRCRSCGEHVADPHAADCPGAIPSALRTIAEADEYMHATVKSETVHVSHRFIAAAERLAADLVEMDHSGTLELDIWPAAAEFVAYVTGEADQWTR